MAFISRWRPEPLSGRSSFIRTEELIPQWEATCAWFMSEARCRRNFQLTGVRGMTRKGRTNEDCYLHTLAFGRCPRMVESSQ